MWAIVPLKNLKNVKTRLSSVLSPSERAELLLCMASDVLSSTSAVPELKGTVVVSCDERVMAMAEASGAFVLEEPDNAGHSAAVAFGSHWLKTRGERSFLQVPADIPLVLPAHLSRLIHSHEEMDDNRKITIVPSHDYGGSNCVICTPPDALALQFGSESFRRHLDAAKTAGVRIEVREVQEIALDIDDPQDLARLAAMPATTRTQTFLVSAGIVARLNAHSTKVTA